MRRADLADLTGFVAVADNLSFRAAASRLGVTPSALSHTMRHFEERLGFRLLNRTTRSVSLTDAGLRMLDRLRLAVEQISRGLDDRHIELHGDSHGPKGRELLEDLVAKSPHAHERARRAACNAIKARIGLWNGTMSKLRNGRGVERSVGRASRMTDMRGLRWS